MAAFWKRGATDEEVSRLRSEVQSLREELIEVRDKVYGWMKRVEMRARDRERPEDKPIETRIPDDSSDELAGRRLLGGPRR